MAKKRKKTKSTRRKTGTQRQNRQDRSTGCLRFIVVLLIIVVLGSLAYRYYDRIVKPPERENGDTPRIPDDEKREDTLIVTRFDCLPVYFYDSEAQYFVPLHLPVDGGDLPPANRARKILDKLVAGPPVDSLIGLIPEETKINSVKVEGDLAIVDFSEDLSRGVGGWERGIVQSILLSLTELPGVSRVQFLIDGNKTETLPQGTVISEPISREGGPNTEAYIPEGKSSGYFYYLEKSLRFLVPVYWTWEGERSDLKAKLKTLYSSPDAPLSHSLVTPAPSGIRINKCEVVNNKLIVIIDHHDFATAFHNRSPREFLEATILTLYEPGLFNDVQIYIGDEVNNRSIWDYSTFADYKDIEIPPVCFNSLDVSVVPTI